MGIVVLGFIVSMPPAALLWTQLALTTLTLNGGGYCSTQVCGACDGAVARFAALQRAQPFDAWDKAQPCP